MLKVTEREFPQSFRSTTHEFSFLYGKTIKLPRVL